MSIVVLVEGKIVQCIGVVIDVEFLCDSMLKIYDVFIFDGLELMFEVQQQLGDGVVCIICLGVFDGLCCGLIVKNMVKLILVLVGKLIFG